MKEIKRGMKKRDRVIKSFKAKSLLKSGLIHFIILYYAFI